MNAPIRTEIDLNKCEHFLKVNWDWSKQVWTLSQSELRSISTSVNTFSKWTEIDLNECEHFLKANWDRSKQVWTLSQSNLRSIQTSMNTFFKQTEIDASWNDIIMWTALQTNPALNVHCNLTILLKYFSTCWINAI